MQSGNLDSAVIWDMGGVLYHFFTEILVAKGGPRGWPIDRLPLGPTGSYPDPHYMVLDRGEINEPEYVRRIVNELARHGIDYQPYKDAELAPPPERAETWALVEQLDKAGRRQMLLTNDATTWLGQGWWESWPHRHLFEGVIDVKDVGISKPSPEPYLACLDQLVLPPGDCLFIDDMHVNCSGAEAVGIQSHWFDIANPTMAIDRLSSRFGLG